MISEKEARAEYKEAQRLFFLYNEALETAYKRRECPEELLKEIRMINYEGGKILVYERVLKVKESFFNKLDSKGRMKK